MSILHVDLKIPGGTYKHDPLFRTTTFVGYVPSKPSSALWMRKKRKMRWPSANTTSTTRSQTDPGIKIFVIDVFFWERHSTYKMQMLELCWNSTDKTQFSNYILWYEILLFSAETKLGAVFQALKYKQKLRLTRFGAHNSWGDEKWNKRSGMFILVKQKRMKQGWVEDGVWVKKRILGGKLSQ